MAENQSNLQYFKIPNPFSLFKSNKSQEKKHKFTDAERSESATIRSLKSQIRQLDDLLTIKDDMIVILQRDLKDYYSTKNENKIWTLAEQFLKGKVNSIQKSTTTNSENAAPSLSDREIKAQFQGAPKSVIKALLSLSDEEKVSELKRFAPGMDDKTIQQGVKILKTMR